MILFIGGCALQLVRGLGLQILDVSKLGGHRIERVRHGVSSATCVSVIHLHSVTENIDR